MIYGWTCLGLVYVEVVVVFVFGFVLIFYLGWVLC